VILGRLICASLESVRLEMTDWKGTEERTTTVEGPSVEDLRSAITTLDGRRQRELFVRASSGSWIGISGGPHHFLLAFCGSDGSLFQALGPVHVGDDAMMIIGGLPTALEVKYVVGPDDAAAAALHFLATEERDPIVDWEQQ